MEKIGEGKTILQQINGICLSLDTIHGKINEMIENIDPILSTPIYESCKRLKDDIDLFESQILYQLNPDYEKSASDFHGLRGRDRLNVFLVGEFSAGKTTFVQRLISDLSGPISGAPATACLVIHKQASSRSLIVKFNNSIVVKDKDLERFERFLNFFDLRKRFNLDQGTWIPSEKELVFDNWGSDKILNFLDEGNRFPEMFNQITWNHKKSKANNKITFLDFVDLYDMPGIGGNEEKHNAVIEGVFQEQRPDIILYLIDTARGTPSDDEKKALKELLSYITKYETLPLFYWVYQKPSGSYSPLDMKSIDSEGNILDKSFLKEKKESIEDFIKELNNSNDNGIPFGKKYREYLRKTIILYARGLTTDTEMSQNAVSLALRDYFNIYGKNYVVSIKKILSDNSKIPQFHIMSFYPNSAYTSNNPFIEEILNLIRRTSDLSISNVRKIIFDSFRIDNDEDLSKYPYDLQQTLKDWRKTTQSIIEEILAEIRVPKKLFDKSEIIGIDNINNKFWKKYNANYKWQTLLFTVQAYYWIKASYDKKIALQYISNIGNAILGNIEKDINRLSKINESLPIYDKIDIE